MIKAIVDRDLVDYSKMIPELLQVLKDVAEDVRRVLATPPAEKAKHLGGSLPGGFYTEKQRRYVIAAIKSGHIVVPYLRTGNLPRAWTVSEVEISGGTASVEISCDPSLAPYGPHVQDPKARPPMHEDWPTAEEEGKEAARAMWPKVIEVVVRYGFVPG